MPRDGTKAIGYPWLLSVQEGLMSGRGRASDVLVAICWFWRVPELSPGRQCTARVVRAAAQLDGTDDGPLCQPMRPPRQPQGRSLETSRRSRDRVFFRLADHLKLEQLRRPEGIAERDVRRIPATCHEHAPGARGIVARIEDL